MTLGDSKSAAPPKRLRAVQGGIREHGLLDKKTLTFYIVYERRTLKYSLAFMVPLLGKKSEVAGTLLTTQWASGSLEWGRSQKEEFARFCAWLPRQLDVPSLKDGAVSKEALRRWQILIDKWFGEVKAAHSHALGTAKTRLGCIAAVLKSLQHNNLFARVSLETGLHNVHKLVRPRPTLAEQVAREHSPRANIADVIDQLVESFAPEDAAVARVELNAISVALGNDIPRSPEALVQALHDLQRRCLDLIAKTASAAFLAWLKEYEKTTSLLASANAELARQIASHAAGEHGDTRRFWKLLRTYARDEIIGSLLLACKTYNGGLAYSQRSSGNPSFLLRLYRKSITQRGLSALLHPTPDAVAAAMLLTGCETGANVAVLCELQAELGVRPVPDTTDAFFIDSIKERAGGKRINCKLVRRANPGHICALEALERLKEAGAALRSRIATDCIFVYRYLDTPSYPTQEFLAHRLRYMLRDAGLSEIYAFTPSAIRPCYLVCENLSRSADSLIVSQQAGHSDGSEATSHYQFRLEQRIRLSAYARQYHQQLEELAQRVSNGPIPPTDESDPDADSRAVTLVVDLNEELVLDACLTVACLNRSNEELVRNRKTHWLDRCEPELAWATVVIEKAKNSAIAHRIPAAKRKADALLQDGFVHFLE